MLTIIIMINKARYTKSVNILNPVLIKIGILVFFVVYTLSTPLLLQKYVLCFGSDGHTAIETNTGISGRCCNNKSTPLLLPENSITDHHSSCDGKCTDILLCSTFNTDSSSKKDIVTALSHTPVKPADKIKLHHNILKHLKLNKCISHLNTPLLSFKTISLLI